MNQPTTQTFETTASSISAISITKHQTDRHHTDQLSSFLIITMTTAKQNSTFLDDIDSDSVSITSTVASEPQEEYEVEAILAEEEGDDGINYLIKWEGYPLHR